MIVGGTGPGNNLSLPEHRRGTLVTGAAQGARLKIQTKQKAKYSRVRTLVLAWAFHTHACTSFSSNRVSDKRLFPFSVNLIFHTHTNNNERDR